MDAPLWITGSPLVNSSGLMSVGRRSAAAVMFGWLEIVGAFSQKQFPRRQG